MLETKPSKGGEVDMKERPILFSAPMVRAILEGRKTMTRRVVKPEPVLEYGVWRWQPNSSRDINLIDHADMFNPFGKSGDRLWVKETWAIKDCGRNVSLLPEAWPDGFPVSRLQYVATDEPPATDYWWNKRSSLFMPRWASRITLEITDVRVERLQEISGEDAIEEGARNTRESGDPLWDCTALQDFRERWDALNAKRGYEWDWNPWVWVIEFRRELNHV